jgi:hypothetical protein
MTGCHGWLNPLRFGHKGCCAEIEVLTDRPSVQRRSAPQFLNLLGGCLGRLDSFYPFRSSISELLYCNDCPRITRFEP